MTVQERYENSKKDASVVGRAKRHDVTVELRKKYRSELKLKNRRIEGEDGGDGDDDDDAMPIVEGLCSPPTLALVDTPPHRELIDEMAANVMNDSDPVAVCRGVVGIRKLISGKNIPPALIDAVLDRKHVIQRLVQFTRSSTERPFPNFDAYGDLIFEVMWLFTNLLSGTSAQMQTLLSFGVLDALVFQFMNNPSMDIKEQAIWAIANVLGDDLGIQCRAHLIQVGVLETLLLLLMADGPVTKSLRTMSWCLVSFCKHHQQLTDLVRDAITRVAHHVIVYRVFKFDGIPYNTTTAIAANAKPRYSGDGIEIISNVLFAVKYLSDLDCPIRHVLMELDFGRVFLTVLDHYAAKTATSLESSSIFTSILFVLSNLAAGTMVHTRYLIEAEIVSTFKKFVCDFKPQRNVAREIFYFLSNIAAESLKPGDCLFALDPVTHELCPNDLVLLEHVLDQLMYGDIAVRTEASWMLYNSFLFNDMLVAYVTVQRPQSILFKALVNNLSISDYELNAITLSTIYSMFKVYTDKNAGVHPTRLIYQFQCEDMLSVMDVYQTEKQLQTPERKIVTYLSKYFDEEEDKDYTMDDADHESDVNMTITF